MSKEYEIQGVSIDLVDPETGSTLFVGQWVPENKKVVDLKEFKERMRLAVKINVKHKELAYGK